MERICLHCKEPFQPHSFRAKYCKAPECQLARLIQKSLKPVFRCENCFRIVRKVSGRHKWCDKEACQEDAREYRAEYSRQYEKKHREFRDRKNPKRKVTTKRKIPRYCIYCGKLLERNYFRCEEGCVDVSQFPDTSWMGGEFTSYRGR